MPPDVLPAIANYLADRIAPDYGGEWEHCIPLVRVVATDSSAPSDVRVWGDYQVWNCRLEGDTLHCVSGGAHPGLMHLRGTNGVLAVFAFEPVPDGSDHLSGAKRIFGRHFAEWRIMAGDDDARKEERGKAVAEYVSVHGLPAKFYKDYGWDPVAIPLIEE